MASRLHCSRGMTLHATHPLFQSTEHDSIYLHHALQRDAVCDDVVVGAGISGLTAALKLASAGRRVIVLDAHKPFHAATAQSTAHLTAWLDAGYVALRRDFGEDNARKVAASMTDAIDFIESNARALSSERIVERCCVRLIAERDEHEMDLLDESDAAIAAGLEIHPERRDSFSYPVAQAMRLEGQGTLHPVAYAGALELAARELGVAIFSDTQVIAVDDSSPCLVHTQVGPTIRCETVFFATHKPQTKLLLQNKLRQAQTYAIAFPWQGKPVFPTWDLDDPYHYVRTATTKDGSFLLVGGEDHEPGTHETHDDRFENLRRYTHDRYAVGEAVRRWSGQVVASIDGLPFIGPTAPKSKMFVATGYDGDGIVFGTIAGRLIADIVLGRQSIEESLFSPARSVPLQCMGAFVKRSAEGPIHLIGDRFRGTDVDSVAEIPPGVGRTVRVNGRRLAVYRDPGGNLHSLSSVCTHLGCLVNFNDIERTWDCQCHGSRFDVEGEVLEGPAVQALTKVPIEDEPRGRPALVGVEPLNSAGR